MPKELPFDSGKPEKKISAMRKIFLCYMAATVFFLIGGIFFGSVLMKPDEPLYIRISYDMQSQNRFFIPQNNGRADFVKPPLVYWLDLAAFEIFGKRIWAARLPIWLLGIATTAISFALGKELFPGSEIVPKTAAALLLFNLFFFQYSQSAMMDVPLAFFVVGTLYTFVLAAKRDPRWLLLCGFLIGFSTLVKGPVGIVLSLVPILAYARMVSSWKIFKAKMMFFGIAAAVVSGLAWPIALLAKGYWGAWFHQFILGENFGKFGGERMPLVILLIGIFGGIAPWTVLLVESLFKSLRPNREKSFLLAWVLGVFLVFALPSRKLPHYMLPALPACCLLIACTDLSFVSIWLTRLILFIAGILWLLGARLVHAHSIQFLVLAGALALLASASILNNQKRLFASALIFGIFLMTFPVVMPALQFNNQEAALAGLSRAKPVGVFCPDDRDPRGFELSPDFSSCDTLQEAKALLQQGGTLIFAEHNQAALSNVPLEIKKEWSVWRTGIGLGAAIQAIIDGNTKPLEEKMQAAILK